MWLLSADNGELMVLLKTKEDLLQYVEMGTIKQFTAQYIGVWTPPEPTEAKKIRLYEEAIPLSRVKEN